MYAYTTVGNYVRYLNGREETAATAVLSEADDSEFEAPLAGAADVGTALVTAIFSNLRQC